MNPVTHLVASGGGFAAAVNPLLFLLIGIVLGAIFGVALMLMAKKQRLGFALMFFVAVLLVLVPGSGAQTAHFITLTFNYTQGTTPAASFLIERGSSAGGPYSTVQTPSLAAACTGNSGPLNCTVTDNAALAAGTKSFYVIVAQDSATPPDQSSPSGEASATWLGNPLAAGQPAAVSH